MKNDIVILDVILKLHEEQIMKINFELEPEFA